MSSTTQLRDAVRLAQQYNINLYRYLINGLVDNSLMVSQLKVEFEDYTSSSMRFFNQLNQIRDSKIPIVRQQEEQNNVLLEQVKRNDQLRQQIHVIRVRGEMGQQIPMVDTNMIVQDFPELCVSRCPSDIPITVLCDLIIRKYNVHNEGSIVTMLRWAEEESISMKMSNPEPIVPRQEVASIRPPMVNIQPVVPITEVCDVTPVISLPLVSCTQSTDVTTCTHPTQSPNNEDDVFDELMSVLADIPGLDTEYHQTVNKKSPCAVSGPVSTTSKLSTSTPQCNSSLLAVPTKKQEVKRDYKEYPEYTTRTSPSLSWDQLIERFQKLDNSNGASKQDQTVFVPKEDLTAVTANQDITTVVSKEKTAKATTIQETTKMTKETAKTDSHDNLIKPSAPDSGAYTPLLATKSTEPKVVFCENPSVHVSKKRKQHAPKDLSNNLTTTESLKRKEQLAALELKKLKTQKVLNDQYKKSWDGKIFLKKVQNVPKVEKTTVTTVPSKNQLDRVENQSAATPMSQLASRVDSQSRNVIQSGVGVINQSTFRVGYQAAYRNMNQSAVRAVNQPAARVVNQSAAIPANQPAVSQPSRKRPASSTVDTPSQAKRRARQQPRIILKIFRENSDWNVEQIVDRY